MQQPRDSRSHTACNRGPIIERPWLCWLRYQGSGLAPFRALIARKSQTPFIRQACVGNRICDRGHALRVHKEEHVRLRGCHWQHAYSAAQMPWLIGPADGRVRSSFLVIATYSSRRFLIAMGRSKYRDTAYGHSSPLSSGSEMRLLLCSSRAGGKKRNTLPNAFSRAVTVAPQVPYIRQPLLHTGNLPASCGVVYVAIRKEKHPALAPV